MSFENSCSHTMDRAKHYCHKIMIMIIIYMKYTSRHTHTHKHTTTDIININHDEVVPECPKFVLKLLYRNLI